MCSRPCRIGAQLAEARAGIESVNRERKLSQQEAKRELSGYETQYRATLEKNAEIEAACAEIEKELRDVTSRLPKYAPFSALFFCRSFSEAIHLKRYLELACELATVRSYT